MYSQSCKSILWSADKKLVWEDFKGNPDYKKTYTAITQYNIYSDSTEFKNDTLVFAIRNLFNPNESWVKQLSEELLTHEQLHFDIAEVYARKLRKLIKTHVFYRNTMNWDFREFHDKVLAECAMRQKQYDEETGHSVNSKRQKEWEAQIAKELEEYRDYNAVKVAALFRWK